MDVSDGICVLKSLFAAGGCPSGPGGGEPGGCLDASDANDDGKIDCSDPVLILWWLFVGAAPPPAPGPMACGPDPDPADALGCDSYPPCG